MTTAKQWTREELVALLQRSDRAVERAILRIWHGQTNQEKLAETTYDHNNRGFSSAHAHVGSYLGKWVAAGKPLTGQWLEKGRKIALRHVRQLLKIANGGEHEAAD